MQNRILAALAFTPSGQRALFKAVEVAWREGSELFVFHALDDTLGKCHPKDPKITDLRSRAARKAMQLIDSVKHHPPKIVFICRPVDPALGVCREAAAIGAHTVVVGSPEDPDQRSSRQSQAVGRAIIEKAPCPVMMVSTQSNPKQPSLKEVERTPGVGSQSFHQLPEFIQASRAGRESATRPW